MSSVPTKQALIERLMFLGQMGSTETALFHQKAAESYGMGITDVKTLSVLMQEGPKSAGQIAKRLHITTGAVTNLIDRLERKKVVSRSADPDDRRKVIIKVNPKLMSSKNAYESMGQSYGKLLAKYSNEQLEMLVDYHEKQIAITKDEIAKLSDV